MVSRVVMPKLTDTMEEGVVVAWKKHEGDPVVAGDVLAEIETDKAVMDLEAFGSGILRRVLVNEGETVQAGALIAVIGESDEDIEPALADNISPTPTESEGLPLPKAPSPDQRFSSPTTPSSAPAGQKHVPGEPPVKASPRAKLLAEKKGVDLRTIKGSGPGERITERDVLGAVVTSIQEAPVTSKRPLSQMRKAIARVMTESKGPVPHFYLISEIAMDEAERLRKQANQLQKEPITLTGLFLKATAMALTKYPDINVSFGGESLYHHRSIDIGIAVALEDGLITPVVRNCGSKSLLALSQEARNLINRTRTRQLKPEEYSGATFSITNLGMYEVEQFIAVLIPPQAATLAIGTVRTIPVVDQNRIGVGRRVKVTLSGDHRAIDGAQGAQFLQEFKKVLEQPLALFLPLDQT